ncbi:uncharacterized protein LOC116199205 [Punica granatum]|uniref:Uncharacterized protein n=2 Tax=Punica granatum TaxID=22663 RepID=A0A218W0H0_PUNGR|nr:uncharacterized protein LOC116199205 [Punica granatum]OWM66324.1 hypothetical protein CDL15_Pgr013541 [Punica granatum]PKI41614.1 hypothetical protein CRG98_038014 [Punica granatum]
MPKSTPSAIETDPILIQTSCRKSFITLMGICLSSGSCAADRATAKLILPDGRLEEFPYAVRVSEVLRAYDAASFICNSDEMEFDGAVSAVPDDEELQPGQLYFALPLSRLDRPLTAQEMAALAVRASSALMRSPGWCVGSRRKVVFPLEGPGDGEQKSGGDFVRCSGGVRGSGCRDGGGGGGKEGRRRRRRSGRRKKFTAELSSIPE